MPPVAPQAEPEPEPAGLCEEAQQVVRRRRLEALAAGLTMREARMFSESLDLSIGALRDLVRLGCPPEQIGRILL